MILLDTNVLSEPLRPNPDQGVLTWLDEQAIETLYLSTISLAELRYGVAVLPDGKRKDTLRASLDGRIVPLFESRICHLTWWQPMLTPHLVHGHAQQARPLAPLTASSRQLPLHMALL